MISLSEFISQIKPSATFGAAKRAAELRASGKDVVSFTVGEPDFDTPQHVKDAAIEALRSGFTKYTATEGIPKLKQAIVAKLLRDQNLSYSTEQICVTNGGKQALAAACAVLLNPGDEAVIVAPYWTSYPEMVSLVGGIPTIVQTSAEEGYLVSPEKLMAAVTPRTKLIILNSPSNPTGASYSAEQLKALGRAIKNHPRISDLMVITDEVYEYFYYAGEHAPSFAGLNPDLAANTIIVNAYSKAYSMTGWRVGYAAAPVEIIKAIINHQSQLTSNVCSIAQFAAACAYDDNAEFPRAMLSEFRVRREILLQAVKDMPGISLPVPPMGAFYAFLRIDGLIGKRDGSTVIKGSADFTNYLLEKYNVAVVLGDAFGDDNAVRVSFALSQERLKTGLSRIADACRSLK